MKRPRLLFLTSRFPYPLEKGDKLRAFHLIRHLSNHFDICLFAINEETPRASWVKEVSPYCIAIKTVVISKFQSLRSMLLRHHIPFQSAYFYSDAAQQSLNEFVKEYQPDVVFCHLLRMSEYAKRLNIEPKVLDYMDAFSKGMERMQSTSSWWLKIPSRIEEKRLLKYEEEIFDRFQYHIIISEQDRAHIPHPERERIDIIPNGVDFEYFAPTAAEKTFDLLFNGHMSYPPNIASALYTANEIFPLLRTIDKNITLHIAGADPVQKIKDLNGGGITVTGWVDDIRTVYSSSRILVAPMVISIGLQNKILQAMAMKIPCVISAMANNALGAEHNKQVLVANTPEEYCRYIQQLLNDKDFYRNIAESAYQFVKSRFTWEENTEKITRVIHALLQEKNDQ